MVDGRPPAPGAGAGARLDRIADAGGATESGDAPVARFGELPDATPEPESEPAADTLADLGRIDDPAADTAAPVADFGTDDGDSSPAAPAPADARLVDAGPDVPGADPVARIDAEALGAAPADAVVVEFRAGAAKRRAGGGRTGRRAGGRRLADPPAGRRSERRRGASSGRTSELSVAAPVPEQSDGADPADEPRPARGRRGRAELEPGADPAAVAREICLRLLTDRARTRQELAQALRRKGVPDDVAHTVLARFNEVGLIDDAAFAGQWVRSRHAQRGLARRAIAMELRQKGVSAEDAGEALAEVDAESEERRARELVDRKLRSLTVDTTEQRTVAQRRLVGMLARKGYGAGTAYRVVKEALAERGAEIDELGDGELAED